MSAPSRKGRKPPDYSNLKRLAQAATAGPWHAGKSGDYTREVCAPDSTAISWSGSFPLAKAQANAAYIAAASPDVVLKLLERLEAAHAEIASMARTTVRGKAP